MTQRSHARGAVWLCGLFAFAACGSSDDHLLRGVKIELVDCKRSGKDVNCHMRALNDTGRVLSLGRQFGEPTYAVEERVDEQWRLQTSFGCGNDIEESKFQDGASVEWSALVHTDAPSFRIGLSFESDPNLPVALVWSNPIATPPAITAKR